MNKYQQVNLFTSEYPIINGITTEQQKDSRQIWGLINSVSRSEFYTAMNNGIKIDLIVEVYAFEYNNQQSVEVDGIIYDIFRTYQKTLDKLELTCVRREQR